MGIKDNFQQALRELTGTEKEDPKQASKVDAIKNAVAASDTSEFDAIRPKDETPSYDDIQRRAEAAANEYDKQQNSYSVSTYQAESPNVAPPPQVMNLDGETADSSAPQQSSQQGMTFGGETASSASRGSYSAQSVNNTADRESAGMNERSSASQQEQRYTAPSQSYGGSGRRDDRYGRQQIGGYQQQSSGGFRQNMGAPDPANEQQMIFNASRYGRSGSDDDEITIVSRNTVIDGNVRSFANMSVDGNIKGNIETTKDIDLNGKVVGNIACNNAQMRTSQIQGNIQMKGNAYMERDTLLIGDLTSTYANVNGKIKGNLDITGKAELKSDAVVFGDISASTITVNDGAIIQGYVSTTFLNKEESRNIFPDTITIGE